jgi:hypothetical protein
MTQKSIDPLNTARCLLMPGGYLSELVSVELLQGATDWDDSVDGYVDPVESVPQSRRAMGCARVQ